MENDLETSLFNIFINAFEQVGQSLWKTIWRPASGWMGGEENVGGRVVVVDIRNYWRYPHLGGCLGWDAGG